MSESTSPASKYVFLNGKAVEHPHESHEHITPIPVYVGVFVALLILTGLTYAVSFANLGPGSLPVAMLVATMKGSLVVAFFMHLAFEDRFYLFIFLTSILLIALFFGFILFDVNSAGLLNDEQRFGGPRIDKQMMDMENAPTAEEAAAAEAAGGGHGGEH